MPDLLIDGDGRALGPAKAVQPMPEQEQRAAEKLAKARERRAARKAGAELPEAPGSPERDDMVTTGGTTSGDAGSFESERTEPQPVPEPTLEGIEFNAHGEPTNLEAYLAAIAVPDPETGEKIHPKLLRRRQEQRAEAQATERQEQAPPLEGPDDAEYEAARATWVAASERLTALATEQAGLPGRIDDAVATGDYPAVQALRQRRAELPFAIETAKLDTVKSQLAFYRLRAARARIAKQQARSASANVHEEFEAFKRRAAEAQNEAIEAANAADDAVRDVGATQRELERLMAELAR